MTDIQLSCDELSPVLDFYTGPLGFRIDSIYPADAPRVARLSGYGIRVELNSGAAGAVAAHMPPNAPTMTITRLSDGDFAAGRAGMQYRDLIPGRYGGRFIASHIRIPDGGPVPDYVHHHDVRCQVIFCVAGWVRVAYEAQGEPMLMRAGDCFLQPPHIRHRVLECSDGMEVVEFTCPAEHETEVDHDMTLPTADIDTARDFGGQRFVFHEADGADWLASGIPGLVFRDSGIAEATNDVFSVIVTKASDGCGDVSLQHDSEIRFLYVLNGRATLVDDETTTLASGDSCAVPPGRHCSLGQLSADFEFLEITVPEARDTAVD